MAVREDLAYEYELSVPQSASKWTRENLENIGIFYSEKSWSVEDLISRLKSRASRRSFAELPALCPAILKFMKDFWNFTIELDSVKTDVLKLKEVREVIRTKLRIFSMQQGLFIEEREHKELLRDTHNASLFRSWCAYMENFLKILDIFLRSYSLSQGDDQEGNFEDLCSKFSMTCFLLPQAGSAFKGEMNIKGVDVSSIPDVCFPKLLEDGDETVQVVSMTEEQYSERFKEVDFDINEVPSKVLGRHGAELLIEMSRSYFSPVVTGMICIGTKIIFTYLDMDVTHAKKIRMNDDVEGCRSIISYTKPYDFLNAIDREEILEPLMWLGQNSRNIFMASVVETSSSIDRNHTKQMLTHVPTTKCKKHWWGDEICSDLNAKEIYNELPAELREG